MPSVDIHIANKYKLIYIYICVYIYIYCSCVHVWVHGCSQEGLDFWLLCGFNLTQLHLVVVTAVECDNNKYIWVFQYDRANMCMSLNPHVHACHNVSTL